MQRQGRASALSYSFKQGANNLTRHVPPQYPQHFPTRIAFIGEAPSHEEIEKGAPLVGPSGRIFNSMLRTANLDRSEFLITNVFSEKIPDNNIANWCSPKDVAHAGGYDDLPPIGPAGYLKPEYRFHLDNLASVIADTKPTVIVPMGSIALWAFTGSTAISANRGSILPASKIAPARKLVPTYHPSFVIKQWKFFTVVVADFIKAYRESEFSEIRLPKKEFLIEPTFEELDYYYPRLVSSDLLSVDIETGWGQITNIGFAPSAGFAVNIPFVDLRRPDKSYFRSSHDEARALRYVKSILEHPVPKLGQNFGGYDFYWLLDKYGMAPRNFIHDTRLLHHALYPELPKDLEFMGASYTQQGAWKSWGRRSDKRDE
jgi:uracil-DNA glycosylase